MISLKQVEKEEEWKVNAISQEVPLTQEFFYGEIQKGVGRKVYRFQILDNDEIIGFVQLIVFPLFGQKFYWYAPYGPVLKKRSDEIFSALKRELKKKIQGSNVVFLRLDFSPRLDLEQIPLAKKYFNSPFKSSYIGAYFQARAEWVVDITKSEDEILSLMHQKTRYSVRLAEKKGVITKIVSNNLIERFYDFMSIMQKTAKRNGFGLHDDNYYRLFFEEAEKNKNGFIVESFFENSLLAAHFVFMSGETAHYLFGASSDERKDLCAPYSAHFRGMLEAKNRGARFYNFGAVSLSGENDHWKTISIFKQKFGGHAVFHSDFFDLVKNYFWYYIYITRKVIKSIT